MSQIVELSYEHVGESATAERRVLFLHGALGSGANLRSIARRFVAARPEFDAWLVDLRGHGDSPKGTPDGDLAAMADDVKELCVWSLPVAAIVGHSLGGKVALEILRRGFGPILSRDQKSLVPLEHVVTLDSNPGSREPLRDGDSALAVIEMLRQMPPRFASRNDFIAEIVRRGKSAGLAQWLAMSTVAAEDGVRFALDLDELRQLLESYFAEDLWPVIENTAQVGVHLVIAEKSSSYSSADRQKALAIAARNPRVSVDFLATDHWVHSEDPAGVLRLLLSRIS
jgi:esterase